MTRRGGPQPDGSFLLDDSELATNPFDDVVVLPKRTLNATQFDRMLARYVVTPEEKPYFRPDQQRAPAGTREGGRFVPEGKGGWEASSHEKALHQAASSLPSHPEVLKGMRAPKVGGINQSGFINVDGKEYFAKIEDGGEVKNEVAAWNVAKALGWTDMVAPAASAVVNMEGGSRHALLQAVLPEGEALVRAENAKFDPDRVQRLFLFEYAIGATDRHAGNFWVAKDGTIYGIDYSRAFTSNTGAGDVVRGTGRDKWAGLWQREEAHKVINAGIPVKYVDVVLNQSTALRKIASESGGWWGGNQTGAFDSRMEKLRSARDSAGDRGVINIKQLTGAD